MNIANIATLINAIATLLWPIFAFVVLFVFRGQLGDLLGRLKKGKLLGQEIELAESLDQLNQSAIAAVAEVASLPMGETDTNGTPSPGDENTLSQVLGEAANSPKAALLFLSSELERELRLLLASMGLWSRSRYVPFSEAIRILDTQSGLPKHVISSAALFWQMRNRLVHGYDATDDDILRAIDSGVMILKALYSIPHEVHTICSTGVEIYWDQEGKKKLEGVKGVIIESKSAGGTLSRRQVFPTTRTDYREGEQVSWEWNGLRAFLKAWYRDPATQNIVHAWNSSSEFAGRHLDEL